MRSLNEIIGRNARAALRCGVEIAKERGEKLNRSVLARRMADLMVRTGYASGYDAGSIYRTLGDLLASPPRRQWRADYLEAFACAIGVPVENLVSSDEVNEGIAELSHARFLGETIGRHLNSQQARVLLENIRGVGERPTLFDPIARAMVKFVNARGHDEAILGLIEDLVRDPQIRREFDRAQPQPEAAQASRRKR